MSTYAPPPATPMSSGRAPVYPLVTSFSEQVPIGRLWGIPFFGVMIRALLAIPHLFVLWILGILVALVWLVSWIPVLVNGRYPAWGYSITGGYLRWQTRVMAYVTLLAGAYPPFGLDAPYDVDVRWDPNQSVPRWAGIPIFGLLIRSIILIPHFIVLGFLGFVTYFVVAFSWAPVLVNGRQAHLVYQLYGGFVRWSNRITAYMLLMTGPYPPFSLED